MMPCSKTGGSDGTGDCLDACNGLYGDFNNDGFMYRYYMMGPTDDNWDECANPQGSINADLASYSETFHPHSPNCYRGCCPSGETCNGLIPACSDNAVSGTTDSYVAEPKYANGVEEIGVNCDACWSSGANAGSDLASTCTESEDTTDDTTTDVTESEDTTEDTTGIYCRKFAP